MNRRPSYQVTEPHPTVPRTSNIHAGRGGAGNYAHYSAASLTPGATATGPASRAPSPSPPPNTRFTSGRGGAGNTFSRATAERRIFSFDEELEREARVVENQSRTPVYHIGRGGAGNAVDEMKPRAGRWGSDASARSVASRDSTSSTESGASGRVKSRVGDAFLRLSRTFSRGP